ncbi:hypothetical protein B0A50_02344 [Salinomyces thailandicus]|uniref:Mus7/MMS22 family protein n=1 Tax=Salinomyces thailandicus TaxID=706561 RepID=A0A4U0U6L9_9PEZI|nr:hypothetical protein B0A50_02344 [Salinomyces thailandica]
MKRWQDRGEVADSDEDEDGSLSLGSESQSPEQAKKRLRDGFHEDDAFGIDSQHEVSNQVPRNARDAGIGASGQPEERGQDGENAEEAWLQPRNATAYSRKVRVVQIDRPEQVWTSRPATPDTSLVRSPEALSTQLVAGQVKEFTRHGFGDLHPEAGDVGSGAQDDAPTGQSILERQACENMNSTRSSPSNRVDGLLNPSQPFEHSLVQACTPQGHSGMLSVMSSPLSEREVSPPPGFVLPRVDRSPAHVESVAQLPEISDLIGDDSEFADIDALAQALQVAGTAPTAPRSLRARKEKQLHPYEYERLRYQQQMKQRGIKPIRISETVENGVEESQDPVYSADDSVSQRQVSRVSSSPVQTSSQLGSDRPPSAIVDAVPEKNGRDSADELPDIDSLINRRLPGALQHGQKRRKLKHVSKRYPDETASRQDDYAIPPSPQSISSDSLRRSKSVVLPTGFRLPFGMTPAALPTPDISSEIRPSHRGNAGTSSDSEEQCPRISHTPALRSLRRRSQVIGISSDSEEVSASKAASERSDHSRRLLREKKRIRGVLPASWLRIDLKAQQHWQPNSPQTGRRLSSSSPPPSTRPQKGVAQRVSRSAASPARLRSLDSSECDSSENDITAAAPSPLGGHSHPEQDRLNVARHSTVDFEPMEVDWIDPMLAGHAWPRDGSEGNKKRQPRIQDAFAKLQPRRDDFSEEKAARRRMVGSSKPRERNSKPRPSSYRVRKRSGPALSILDAPSTVSEARALPPQFVRLAQREAKSRPSESRHSPSRKMIRLATAEDTEEATATLRAWRAGTVARRLSLREPQPIDSEGRRVDNDHARKPLVERDCNQQSGLPSPVRKKRVDDRTQPWQRPSMQQPQPRQTRLQPSSIDERRSPSVRHEVAQGSEALSSNVQTERSTERVGRRPRQAIPSVRLRGAQLETLENSFDHEHRTAAFERRINRMTETIAARARTRTRDPMQLDRFLAGANPPSTLPVEDASRGDKNTHATRPTRHRPTAASRPRKRRPRHLDTEMRRYRQPSEPLPETSFVEEARLISQPPDGPLLHGLGPFGTKYATDFDVLPLPPGTYFHESTFIGSGDLAAALRVGERDLSAVNGHMRVYVDGDILEWSTWTEEVAAGLARIPAAVLEAIKTLELTTSEEEHRDQAALVTSNVDHMLRSVVRYCSKCLAFLDPVDRLTCVEQLQRFVEDSLELTSDIDNPSGEQIKLQEKCLEYGLVTATQAHQLTSALMPLEMKSHAQGLVRNAASKLASYLLPQGLASLRLLYEDMTYTAKREAGIRDNAGSLSGLLILRHCLRQSGVPGFGLWTTISNALGLVTSELSTLQSLDKTWYDIFTILPALEVDHFGMARSGMRLWETCQDWSLVKRLLDRTFELYPATSKARGSTINDYARAVLTRCFRLIARWGWWQCESVLNTIFDFFAHRGLAQLDNEPSRGSPAYLQELPNEPSIDVQAGDSSFHIFLKTLIAGLQGMRKAGIYNARRVGGIAWRLIPNHGRTYRKDADIKETDLSALRNHHDLLCTLYYATPPGFRLRLDLLRSLVDHGTSHREACRLNVRAWTNLASYQASLEESTDALRPFIEWYRDMLQTTMSQYRLAKTEAEQDYATAKAGGAIGLTESVLATTIASNQRHIAATLVDIFAGLRRALLAAKSLSTATLLVEGSRFWSMLSTFDVSERRLFPVLDETLAVITTSFQIHQKYTASEESQQTSEESQDYGDFGALEEVVANETAANTVAPPEWSTIPGLLSDPVNLLVSNIFGADQPVDDALLTKLVDLLVLVAMQDTKCGKRSWTTYLDAYSSHSWHQLRDTEQRRKLTPYFLARIVNNIREDFDEVRIFVIRSWLTSTIEREARLKYQHDLTNALLNRVRDEPLLENLPFSSDSKTGLFDVTLHDFRQRRLSLLSTVLFNMRRHYHQTKYCQSRSHLEVAQRYTELLKSFMLAMKNNYQHLQGSFDTSVADPSVQGNYVEFVQQVVAFLQQHTTDICRVDSFFTDSAAFPLPAADPGYVVGRLKSYLPKLEDGRARKQLATFVLTINERAAVDHQLPYLSEQLRSAMEQDVDQLDTAKPTLRNVLLAAIFPAFIETALASACCWILALPVLQASAHVLESFLHCVDLGNSASVEESMKDATAFLQSLQQPLARALRRGQEVRYYLNGSQDYVLDPVKHNEPHRSRWADTKAFAKQELEHALNDRWSAVDGQYFARWGGI